MDDYAQDRNQNSYTKVKTQKIQAELVSTFISITLQKNL